MINQGSLTRYASNGLFLEDSNPSDYEGRLKNVSTVVSNETLCKSGLTTGYTCGKVTSTSANINGEINYEVNRPGYYLVASGDSGGANFRSSNGYLIGITSRTSIDFKAPNGSTYGYTGYFTPYKPMNDRYGLTLYTSDTPTRILN